MMKRTMMDRMRVLTLVMLCISLPLLGCSSCGDKSEEITGDETVIDGNTNQLIGFWLSDQCNENDVMNQNGLQFTADGVINYWYVTPDKWDMKKCGNWSFKDDTYEIDFRITDNSYSIKYLKNGRLIIDHLNGWTMEHDDQCYKKMKVGPVFVN